MKPEPKTFTKDNPCTKADLWTCFRRAQGFVTVQVDTAHATIGINAPRAMERNGYVVKDRLPQGDYYRLTPEGEAWLTRGIESYIKNHPSERDSIPFLGGGESRSRRRTRVR